jgi:LPXTG-motif cell wall-anchored protein
VSGSFVTSTTVLVGVSSASLPRTGAPSALLVLLGLVLMAAGLTLSVIGRAGSRRAAR